MVAPAGTLRLLLHNLRAAAAPGLRISSAATPAVCSHFADHDNLKADLLECELVAGPSKEAHCLLRRFLGSAEFDPHGFSLQMGKVFLHLSVQDEGDVSVEFLLELEELSLSMLPGTGLEHRKHQDILASVVGKGIQHTGPLDPRTGRRGIRAGQIFAEGNHM